VLLRVGAAGVDPSVWHLMTGLPYVVRLMGCGLRAPRTRIRGWAVAGRVEAVGRDVAGLRPGDDVFGTCEGAFAEYATAREDRVALAPASLTVEQAAAVPVSAGTALQGLRDRGRLRPGQTVMVIGAGGGVGTFAVQIAGALGARVTGACSTAKVDLVRSIGADEVIDSARDDPVATGARYDLILDTAGNRSLSDLRRALAPRGTLVIVGGEGGGRWLGGFDRQALRAPLLALLVGQELSGVTWAERREDLEFLRGLIQSGAVTPVVDRTYPLAQAADAIRYASGGHARGKVVLSVPGAVAS
jgi:NADPH:quinone reductase-like Zn-dependent oxidoreductase